MSKEKNYSQYGNILFLIGIGITVIGALLNLGETVARIVTATLIILGIAVGVLNITNKEAVSFIVGGIAIILALQPFLTLFPQRFGLTGTALAILGGLYSYIIAFIVPAVLVVAFRTCFQTAKD